MTIRWDIEPLISQTIVSYLVDVLDPSILAICPAVTFYDPMSIDEDNRIVVQVPNAVAAPENPAVGEALVEVGMKSRWNQPTYADDMSEHFSRVSAVRAALIAAGLEQLLTQTDGFKVQWQKPRINFTTRVTTDGWIYSETQFPMNYGVNAV